ncbi:MAG: hypothetical protein IJZ75_00130 [Clostridia bacterium]|nr:hypothetical protein [Clostridia bacterium]
MLILKISGLALTLSASLLFGFYKVSCLKARRDGLRELCLGLKNFESNLTFGLKELPRLLAECFSHLDFLEIKGCGVEIKQGVLSQEDSAIVNEFFSCAGGLDSDGESERTRLYISLLEGQLWRAEENLKNEGKLWRTLSLCIGVGGGILFL